jgi:hypothetical protein
MRLLLTLVLAGLPAAGWAGTLPSTSTTTTSTTTTTTAVSTTSTTMPTGCTSEPTFASLNCRLADLIVVVDAAPDLGKLDKSLTQAVTKAKMFKERAEDRCSKSKKRSASGELRKCGRKMITFLQKVKSKTGRTTLTKDTHDMLIALGQPIRDDVGKLRKSLVCPDDAK